MQNKDMNSLEEYFLKEFEEKESKGKNAYYNSKMISVAYARKLGIPDDEIEIIYNIKLKP